jgi:hypothetical protein
MAVASTHLKQPYRLADFQALFNDLGGGKAYVAHCPVGSHKHLRFAVELGSSNYRKSQAQRLYDLYSDARDYFFAPVHLVRVSIGCVRAEFVVVFPDDELNRPEPESFAGFLKEHKAVYDLLSIKMP